MSDSENELDSENKLLIDDVKDKYDQKKYEFTPSTSLYEMMQTPEKAKPTEYIGSSSVEEVDGGLSDSSDDSVSGSTERCAICLGRIKGQVGSPDAEGCEHYFCLLCILEWTKTNPTCPQDRRSFERILVRESIFGEVVSTLQANKNIVEEENLESEDPTFCEVCGSSAREDCLLLCDGCDLGYHLECLSPPLQEVPIEEWFCPLCVAINLPQLVMKTKGESSKRKQSQKQKKNKKKALLPRTRMIPRTRATERVLQRIERTRDKTNKKQKKYKDDSKEKQTVQLFNRAKPFGNFGDDDVDAAFNDDEYADKLLSSSSSSSIISKHDKKEFAAKKLDEFVSTPLPSYAGRSSHPSVDDRPASYSTDLLINILEEQDVLLTHSKHVSLTKERKLIKKDGAKPMEFNVDRENRVMAELLPSQKKAKEKDSNPMSDSKEKRRSETNWDGRHEHYDKDDKRDFKHEHYDKDDKRNLKYGHRDSRYQSYKSSDRDRNSYSDSYKSGHYRSYHSNSNRKKEKNYDYKRRDSKKYRERSRSREKKEDHRTSRDYCGQRIRRSRSRSKSREKWRGNNRHKRSPERSSRRSHCNSSSSSSFWENDYIDTFSKNSSDFPHKDSVHTTNFESNIHKENEANHIAINLTSPENGTTLNINSSPNSNDKQLEDSCNSKNIADAIQLSLNSVKGKSKGSSSNRKRKDSENDCPSVSSHTEYKKQKLKSLFGDETEDQIKESKQSSFLSFNRNNAVESEKQDKSNNFPISEQVINVRSPCNDKTISSPPPPPIGGSDKEIGNIKVPSNEPSSFSSPSFPARSSYTTDVDDDMEISVLSESSREFIFKSLFGKTQTQNDKNCPTTSHHVEAVSKSVENKIPALTFELRENNSSKKDVPSVKEAKSEIDFEDEMKNNFEKNKKKFANLFGEFSDSDGSISEVEKKLETKPNKVSTPVSTSNTFEKVSTHPAIKGHNSTSTQLLNTKELNNEPVEKELKSNDIKEKYKPLEDSNSVDGISKTSTLASKIKVNKLHLEMKVVDETKKFLNPYYQEKGFSKQIYKEIVAKCVSKVLEVECSNTVDPKKIQKLVDGYVQVYMHRTKKNSSQQQKNFDKVVAVSTI